jgi:hypothetical protein
MTRSHEDDLHEAIWALHDALQRRDGIEERLRGGDADPELYGRGLVASEAVLHARMQLYRVLLGQGWTAPPAVATQLQLDSHLVREASEHLL